MLSTAKSYSQLLDVNINEKLAPINSAVDAMLTRLEELQTMCLLVQQERNMSVGLNGSLVKTLELDSDLNALCQRINSLEKLTVDFNLHISALESKVDAAIEQFGYIDNTNKLKNFFKTSIFKKTSSERTSEKSIELGDINLDDYFSAIQMSESSESNN